MSTPDQAIRTNETHDPALRSWVASAQAASASDPASAFPVQNLPFAVFRRARSQEPFRGGVAIGDQVLDLDALATRKLVPEGVQSALQAAAMPTLNRFMQMGPAAWSALRLALSRLLRESPAGGQGSPQNLRSSLEACLVPQSEVEYTVPATVGDYTDFYTSIYHATNIGRLFRPDNPLLPNYRWVPIGYHGRSSSLIVSGTNFHRPVGQTKAPDADRPSFGPCRRLDYELELGVWMGPGNALGKPIPITEAEQHVFGLCLFNDWSARDIQAWEYQPLGPFLSKNFASSVSPWIVTMEALAPFRVPFERAEGEPDPLPYLDSEANRAAGALDLQLEVLIRSAGMRNSGHAGHSVCRTSYRHAYWTIAQLIAHHSVNGCNLRAGDLYGTGTLSGPTASEAGALIELTSGGKNPVSLPDGSTRSFLEDGDEVVLRGWCTRDGAASIGFGDVRGVVLPARTGTPA